MQTIIDLPENLVKEAQARAASNGCTFQDLVAAGLEIVLKESSAPNAQSGRRIQFPLIASKNPAHRLTPEMIAAAEEELLESEAAGHANPSGH